MFSEAKIGNLNVDNWIISENTTLNQFFSNIEVDTLDLSTWDVSGVNNME